MNPHEQFREEVRQNIERLGKDVDLQALSRIWVREITPHKWAYNFTWLGRPAIQFPNDVWAMQEIIWETRPDLIIETGIAHGGSLIFSASMLALLDICDAIEAGGVFDPKKSFRKVLGMDVDIRAHNRSAIESHPFSSRIQMLEGSSVDPGIVEQVKRIAGGHKRILVCLDSNHTHDHVLAELHAYAPLVSPGSYCVVFDTVIEDMPVEFFGDRPWGKGDNPKTAVLEFLKNIKQEDFVANDGGKLFFNIDKSIDHKLLISVAPDGFLKRVCI